MEDGLPFLPFAERFHGALRDGTKNMTCRNSKYGEPGQTVDSPVGPLLLCAVERVTLGFVKWYLWRHEGVGGPEEFEAVWVGIHPRAGWDPSKKVWLHVFTRVGGAR